MPVAWADPVTFPGQGARGLNRALPYPRIAVVNSYGGGGAVPPTTTATFKRYPLVIASNTTVNPATLRAVAPNSILLFYVNSTQIQVNNATNGVPGNGMTIFPGWWLTSAGALTTQAILVGDSSLLCGVPTGGTGTPATDWPAVPFPLQITSADRATFEVVVVTSKTTFSNGVYTLAITRGNWNSAATAFAVGARVGALQVVPNFSTSYYLNLTPFCPRQGGTTRWSDYVASWVQTTLTTFPDYDGVFLDSSNTYLNPSVNNADADGNNLIDPVGGDGPGPGPVVYTSAGAAVAGTAGPARGVYNGMVHLLTVLRNQSAHAPKVILTNGSGYPPLTDGMFHEDFFTTSFSAPPQFNTVHKLLNAINVTGQDANLYPVTLINPIQVPVGSAVTGSPASTVAYTNSAANFQKMRYGLALSCMTNGFFQFNWNTLFHGQCWIFDEYYKALGTATTADLLTTDTSIPVVDSSKFAINDVIRVPHAVKETAGVYASNTEDETMTITGIPDGTHLTVTRANAVKGTQITGTAVFKDSHITAGMGWLGQPKGPATNNFPALGAAVSFTNTGFETSSPALTGAGQTAVATFTGWTFVAVATAGNTPAQGILYADSTTSQSGTQCARIVTGAPTITSGAFTFFNVKLSASVTMTVTTAPITISFWAKGDRNQQMSLRIRNAANSANLNTVQFFLTSTWSQYWMTVYPAADTGITLQFEFSGDSGIYWLDTVQVFNGDANIYTRDFDNGFVIANATNTAQNVTLPAITGPYTTYKRLAGNQVPGVNDGTTLAPGAVVSMPLLDGLFLAKA